MAGMDINYCSYSGWSEGLKDKGCKCDGKFKSPYGSPGDQLWLRETWAPARVSQSHEDSDVCYFVWDGPTVKGSPDLQIFYRADGEDNLPSEFSMPHGNEIPWHSPIYMPRWASRITLEVVSIRVERLRDISETNCVAEGIELKVSLGTGLLDHSSAYSQFKTLWDSIYASKGTGWDANPWVWVVEFKRAD
jgi:hypothetical protein